MIGFRRICNEHQDLLVLFFDLVKALISNAFILIVVVSWLIDIMRDSRLPCFRNFGMQTFHCVNECISEIIRGCYSCIYLPSYQELTYSSLAALMLANMMVSLDSQIILRFIRW